MARQPRDIALGTRTDREAVVRWRSCKHVCASSMRGSSGQQNIFDPLGMDASSVDEPDPMLATAYGSRMPDGSRMVFPSQIARELMSTVGEAVAAAHRGAR